MKNKLTIIQEWIDSNNFLSFKGSNNGSIEVEWENSNEDSLNDFLLFVKNHNPSFIILKFDKYTIEFDDTDTKKKIRKLEEPYRQQAKDYYNELLLHNNEFYYYNIGFVYAGVYFFISETADWYEKNNELEELLEEESIGYEEQRLISKSDLIEYAKKLSEDILFRKAQNKTMREYATVLFIKQNPTGKKHYNLNDLVEMASAIYKYNEI